jgi:hypothetical protein
LDNTGLDLATLQESNEMLQSLKSLRVSNEKYTDVPSFKLFKFQELEELDLNAVGIAAVSEDTFDHLEDTLRELRLRENRLKSFPMATSKLVNLETLDLEGNDISTIPDDMASQLEEALRSLNYLIMDRINCTCELGKSKFVQWIRSHAIKGATCNQPKRLLGHDISTTPTEDFCYTTSSSTRTHLSLGLLTSTLLYHTLMSH